MGKIVMVLKINKQVMNDIKKLVKSEAKVGIFNNKYDNGQYVAEVAYFLEYGTNVIPEYAFARNGVKKANAKIVKRAKAKGLKFNAVEIGTIIEASIKLNIVEDNSIPNKESTIKAKSRRGKLKTTSGIDSGLYRNSWSTVHVN